MSANTGTPNLYADGDQRNAPQSEIQGKDRFEEGKENSHQANDSKDERSIANRLAREEKKDKEDEEKETETEMLQRDPEALAKSHGNKPSKGATIDAQIQAEEEAELAKKGHFGPKGT